MNRDEHELQEWGRRAGDALRATEQLDAATAARLRAARARALAAAGAAAPRPWVWAVGGAAAAAMLVLALRPSFTPPAPPARSVASHEVLEWVVDEQDPQFYEDLDLYLWLAREDGQRG